MKRFYSLVLAGVCAVLCPLSFVSCDSDDNDGQQQQKVEKDIDPKEWKAAINGTWENVINNSQGHEVSIINGVKIERDYTISSVERYSFNVASNTGTCYYKSTKLYNGETTPEVTLTDYDFKYEFNQSYDDFFQSYSTSIGYTITSIREGAKYHKVGETGYLEVRSVKASEITLDMTTYKKK